MAGVLNRLPRAAPMPPGRPEVAGPDHPMRAVTRQAAFEPGGWTPERAARVTELFDGLAAGWNERRDALRTEPLVDALDRGGPFGPVCLEPGSGTGLATEVLVRRFATVVCVDISWQMLTLAPAGPGRRVRADGAALPVRPGSADAVVLVNALLFPAEVDAALAPAGALVWVNSLGDATPIHLDAADVAEAMPGRWSGLASEAGWGTWAVLRRD
ncbi:MAG TPA: class I SAM-dependent methyltransferase [Acidimicrobiales bacterium]|nr:class I SAM-dependent methyltransferase [Acidimicrobiales bacterium]